MIEFGVRDQGPGVPADMRTRVFEKYVQLESRPKGPSARAVVSASRTARRRSKRTAGRSASRAPSRAAPCFEVWLPPVPPARGDAQRSDT